MSPRRSSFWNSKKDLSGLPLGYYWKEGQRQQAAKVRRFCPRNETDDREEEGETAGEYTITETTSVD
jgi:hypothetical protein